MIQIHTIDLRFLDIDQAIASYLIKTTAGPILIESGPYSTYDHLKEALRTHDVNIEEIKHVFLTHIHLDHAGAAWALAQNGAHIYVHPFGIRHLTDPSKLMASAKMIYRDDMDRLWNKMEAISEKQLIAVEHLETFRVGDMEIKSIHTPGHAKHHIAWQVEDNLFAGDVAGVKIQNGPVQPPCPPPDINLEDWLGSIKLLRDTQSSKIYLTHFDKVENIDQHLDELEDSIQSWSSFIKEKSHAGLSNEEIVPLFIEFTNGQLRFKGLNDLQIAQYQAANPSWMSVAGLMRYWQKKEIA